MAVFPTPIAATGTAAALAWSASSPTATLATITPIAATGTAAALVWSANVATAQLWLLPTAPQLSGLVDQFYIEHIQLTIQPAGIVTAVFQLFDRDQGRY